MKNLTAIISGIILPFISGCAFLFKSPFVSGVLPNPKLDPILPPSTIQEISKRAEAVTNSLEKHFSKELVVYIKGADDKEDRYVHLNISTNKPKTLKLTVYKTKNPIEEKIERYFIREQDETRVFYHPDSAKILDEDYDFRVILNDSKINGLNKSEPEDYLRTNSAKGEETLRGGKRIMNGQIKEDNLNKLLEEANLFYLDYLKRLINE